MILPFFSPLSCFSGIAGPEEDEEPSGENVFRLIQIRLATPSLEQNACACQHNSPKARIADSSSINAASFSSARTTKRFPAPRCEPAIQIVRALESIAETQPQLILPC
jgi:hypothetical protein